MPRSAIVRIGPDYSWPKLFMIGGRIGFILGPPRVQPLGGFFQGQVPSGFPVFPP